MYFFRQVSPFFEEIVAFVFTEILPRTPQMAAAALSKLQVLLYKFC